MDVDTIALGTDYRSVIEQALDQSRAMLVGIGDRWLEVRDAGGQRRLDDPQDFVRLEIEGALSREVPVVPVWPAQNSAMHQKS